MKEKLFYGQAGIGHFLSRMHNKLQSLYHEIEENPNRQLTFLLMNALISQGAINWNCQGLKPITSRKYFTVTAASTGDVVDMFPTNIYFSFHFFSLLYQSACAAMLKTTHDTVSGNGG